MRIAFFVTYFPKLSEVFLLNQVLALLERGHDVQLFALADPGEAMTQPGAERLLREGRIHQAGMPVREINRWTALARSGHRFALRELRHCFDYSRYGNEALSLRNLYRLVGTRGKLDGFDVAHAQFGDVGLQCAMLRRLGVLRAPLVTSFRGNDMSGYLANASSKAYRALFEHSAFCLPVAERWRRRLIAMGCEPDRIRVLPSGILTDRIPVRKPGSLARRGHPAIVSACRLDKQKGIGVALEAFAALKAIFPGATYDIVGDGPERAALEEKARRLGLTDRVRWHGASTHDRVLERIAACDIHWFTSRTLDDRRTEGVPNILKETQAAGLPAIAFDHPGVSEAMAPGETGVIVPEGDIGEFVRQTVRLLGNPGLLDSMGHRASIMSKAKFDLATITDRLEQTYRDAVAVTRPSLSERTTALARCEAG